MRCLCVGYHHIHDKEFTVERPDGSGDWLLLIVKSPAVFRIDGEEIHTKAGSYIIFPLHAPLYYSADRADYIDDWLHFFPDEEDLRLQQRFAFCEAVPRKDRRNACRLP